MVNPQTVNVGIIVPLTGADVDLWGEVDVNPNMIAIDGLIGGVQTIALTNTPVTLTSPAGFLATPTPGPTQSQNRVLRFTGALSANVTITLPLPGVYVIDNLTTGNFVLSFRGNTVTEVVAVDQGERQTIYNDGANVRFVDLGGRIGQTEMWAGLSAMPAWVGACTKRPYLLCDGAIYNFSDFPYLGARLGSSFGGNGITTFGVPDHRGRLSLPYDGTGARITSAVCGINGQTLGAAADNQGITLTAPQIPTITSSNNNVSVTVSTNSGVFLPGITGGWSNVAVASGGASGIQFNGFQSVQNITNLTGTVNVTVTSNNTGGGAHSNVQPSIVTGISVIRAG